MNATLLLWLGFAVLVFWCVGLYNRVMRIRARGIDAFGSIDKHQRTFGQLVQTHIAGGADLQSPEGEGASPGAPAAWAQLIANVVALDAASKVARNTPLAQAPLSQMALAIHALQIEWQMLRDEPADLAGSPVPDVMRLQWEEASFKLQSARDAFNQIMARYNEALQQFPASVVVGVMGFKPAGIL